MRCTTCGTDLIAGKKFCHNCGTRVLLACTNCGASVEPTFHFCPDCGFRVAPESAEAPAPSAAAPAATANGRLERLLRHIPEGLAQKIRASTSTLTGERKQVTVLFCDLVGSTAIAERLDPEEYHELLEHYLELAFREIYRFEGIVNQLAGDGMMALFGAPVAHEDAPQRAVFAALAIREALREFNDRVRAERGIELQARFGINTGPVVVGTVGNDLKMDYTAIGDTTNLASRLESLAGPGTILVSDATYRLVRGLFEVKEAGPFTVKGKSEPVVAYQILAASEATTPMAVAAERGLTPFVGRDEELLQLETCFQRLAGRLPQVVAVVGDAGLGKSRLLYEFKQHLTEQQVVFFEARCSALNQMVAHSPWVDMLRQYFELGSNEPTATACKKVALKVRPWDEQLDQIYPFVCHMLSLPAAVCAEIPADQMKRQTFEAVSRLIGGEALRAPVVMLIEDLHWIDEPSGEMLDRAVAELKGRIMMVVSHRPDYHQAWRPSAAFTQLNLRSLSDEDTTEIIRALASGPLPADLERLILTKAEGSPFFAEEITRALIEEGYLTRDNGHHRLTRPVEEIRIPGTVQEVIAARLDRLGADAKRVLQVAAVMGRQFSRHQLTELLAADGIDVGRELEEIERRGIIHRKHLFSNDEFRFGESLTQEVAYEGLLLRQRRQLHERVGALLESSAEEGSADRSALLAHHFARSDNREKAVEALLRAARDAEQVPSYRTAARFYREAWDLSEQALRDGVSGSFERLALAAAAGISRMTIIYNAPDPGDTERVVKRARELAEGLGDAENAANFCSNSGILMMRDRNKFADGLALVEEGQAIAQRAGLALPALTRGLAWVYLLDGRFELARRTVDWVVSEFERAGHLEHLSDIYLGSRYMRARILYHSDDLDEALAYAAATYELAVRVSNRMVQSGTASTLAHTHFIRGAYADAKRWADRSLEMARVVGNASAMRTEAAVALAAAVEMGELVSATPYLELIGNDITPEGEVAINSNLVVEGLLAVRELKRAHRLAQYAYTHASGRMREMLSAVALGNVLVYRGREHWGEAERCYERAVSLGEALGARSTVAAARLGAAEIAAERGDAAACARHLHQAVAICRDLGLQRYLTRAQRLLGDVDEQMEQPA